MLFIKQYLILPVEQQKHHGFDTTQKVQRHNGNQHLNDEDNLEFRTWCNVHFMVIIKVF